MSHFARCASATPLSKCRCSCAMCRHSLRSSKIAFSASSERSTGSRSQSTQRVESTYGRRDGFPAPSVTLATRFCEANERADDAVEHGGELRLDRPGEAQSLGSFPASEHLPRRCCCRLIASLLILPTAIGTL